MDAETYSPDAASTSSVVPMPLNLAGGIPWPEAPSINQNFSLPPSIMYYMAKNPSTAKCYLKMAQSCKYFFEKLPILVVKKLWKLDGPAIYLKEFDDYDLGKPVHSVEVADISKLSSQIWLTTELDLRCIDPQSFSTICRKLYQTDVITLGIYYSTVLFDDFQFIASSVKRICLEEFIAVTKDGSIVMLENVLESCGNIERITSHRGGIHPLTVNPFTLKKITNLPNLGHLEAFDITFTNELFSVDDIAAFMKKLKNAEISLQFNFNMSPEYKNQLNALVDEVIESEVPNHYIWYDGMDREKLKILCSRHHFYSCDSSSDDSDYYWFG